jgi:hypothetical protein
MNCPDLITSEAICSSSPRYGSHCALGFINGTAMVFHPSSRLRPAYRHARSSVVPAGRFGCLLGGNLSGMRKFLATGGVTATVIVASWHILARFLETQRRLAASGELEQRRVARRRARIDMAISRARERETSRRAVRHGALVPVYASVQVGSVREAEIDIDDVGLLEASMRRRLRVVPEPPVVARMPLPIVAPIRSNDFTWLEQQRPVRARLTGPALLVGGATATLVPLMRPLGDAAPWMALVAACLVVAGWAMGRDTA